MEMILSCCGGNRSHSVSCLASSVNPRKVSEFYRQQRAEPKLTISELLSKIQALQGYQTRNLILTSFLRAYSKDLRALTKAEYLKIREDIKPCLSSRDFEELEEHFNLGA